MKLLKQKLYQAKADRAKAVEAMEKAVLDNDNEAYEKAKGEAEKYNAQIERIEEALMEKGRFPEGGTGGKPGMIPEGHEETGYAKAVKSFAAAARNGFAVGKAAGDLMSEGVDADGGYTVPQDIVTKIISLRESKESLLDLVTVHPVTTLSGRRTRKKRGQHQGFATVAEAAKMGKVATPQFDVEEYEIEKRRGYLPVTNELPNDSDNNIAQVVEEWLGDEARVTANKEILAIIATKNETDLVNLDGILNAWIKLGSAFRATSKLVTNDDGLAWLGTLKDKNERYLLNPNPAEPNQLNLCVGSFTIPVKSYDNATIPSNGTKIPICIGDLKEGISYWDRQLFTVEVSKSGVVGDFNAVEQDLQLWIGSMRDDCTMHDEAAFVNGYIDTAAAAAAAVVNDEADGGAENGGEA